MAQWREGGKKSGKVGDAWFYLATYVAHHTNVVVICDTNHVLAANIRRVNIPDKLTHNSAETRWQAQLITLL
jgi:regulator of extracellular matrix RemA (YlzA/DUF370 family)